MRELGRKLRRFAEDQSGATAIEYGLIAALVAVGAIMAITSLGDNVRGMFNTVSTKAGSAMANAGN